MVPRVKIGWCALAFLSCLLAGAVARGKEAAKEDGGEIEGEPAGEEEWELGDLPLDEPMYESEVVGYAISPTDESAGFGQTIEVETESARYTTVSDVLSSAVGVRVQQMGGLGSYGAASIRGSTPGQVPVYLDGVLLNASGFSSVNLGDLSLDGLDRIEVYRGSAPIDFGTPGIGGVISLRTREIAEPSTELSLTYGSWDTARLMAMRRDRLGEVGAMAALTVSGSRGDFLFLDRNGTLLNDEDDSIERRANNHRVSYGALVKLDGELRGARWTLANDLAGSVRGVPGIESMPTEHTALRTLRDSVGASVVIPADDAMTVTVDLGYLLLEEDFDDSHDEIGIGAQRNLTRADTGSFGLMLEIEPVPEDVVALRLDARYERMQVEDILRGALADPRHRVRTALAAENRYSPAGALLLTASVRLEQHHGVFGGGAVPGTSVVQSAESYDDLFFQPALGFRYELADGLFLRANAGRYVRAPDLAELFGDRGTVQGNPELEPEVALNADAGLTYAYAGSGRLDMLRLEAVAFGSRVEDLIAYVQNSQNTVRPENVHRAEIAGAEASAGLKIFDLVALQGNYTFMRAVNRSDYAYYEGKRLPGRPAHQAYGKIQLETVVDGIAGRFWFDADYAGTNYLDQANLVEDTLSRFFLGTGVQLESLAKRLSFTVEVHNLLDTITVKDGNGRQRPLRDFESFPLPGRTVLATLNWRT